MYSKGRIELLEGKEISKLNSRVFEILEKVGVRVDEDNLLKHLEHKGFKVDKKEKVVRFRPKEITDVIEYQKKRIVKNEIPENKYFAQIAATVAPFYYDFDKKERRYATKNDLIDLICFSDARGDRVSLPVTAIDVDPLLEPIESLLLLIKYAHHPSPAYVPYSKSTAWISTFATSASQVEYLAKINNLLYGEPVPPRGPDFMTSPLTMGTMAAEYLLEVSKYNVPFYCIGTQPISGMTAPLSITGAIVTGACEILGGWVIIKSLVNRPNLTGAIGSGITDTRKAVVSFNAPEAILQNAGLVEVFDKMYGGHVDIAAGNDYIDAKVPGFEALYERIYRALAAAAFCGRDFYTGGSGLLDQGRVFSPVQFLLDEQTGEGFWQFTKGIPMDEESIRLETFREVGFSGKSFMETDHTLLNCRKSFWIPGLFERNVWIDLKTELCREEKMLERANEKYKNVLRKYERPEHDAQFMKEICEIFEDAKLNLLKN